ncbi:MULTISPECIES: hypothetical protein [Bacillus]|uniref:hypothetical protein n=1 Tax=Bacillus TaxID=1386 RepID=UPI000BFB8F66|nr:hypothetical protein [Bacillus cereus]PGY07664.1 hypothetical protein COE23_27800 [Bacillus cereus]
MKLNNTKFAELNEKELQTNGGARGIFGPIIKAGKQCWDNDSCREKTYGTYGRTDSRYKHGAPYGKW